MRSLSTIDPKASSFDADEYVAKVVRAFGINIVPEKWDTVRRNLSGVRQPTTTAEWFAAEQSARKSYNLATADLTAPEDLPLTGEPGDGCQFSEGYYHSSHAEDYRIAVETIDAYGEAWFFIAAEFYQWRVAQGRLALERAAG